MGINMHIKDPWEVTTEELISMLPNSKAAKQVNKLIEEIEHLRVQLAGCGVAARCNTLESMEKQCVDRDAYGWSASYGDVLDAIKREIKYREALKRIIEEGDYTAPEGMKHIAKAALER